MKRDYVVFLLGEGERILCNVLINLIPVEIHLRVLCKAWLRFISVLQVKRSCLCTRLLSEYMPSCIYVFKWR